MYQHICIAGVHTYTWNESAHTEEEKDEILAVSYEDGRWSKPYYDCGGGNIWMLTYTVPFFGYRNGTYFFKYVNISILFRKQIVNSILNVFKLICSHFLYH